MISNSLMTEDYSDILKRELDGVYGDLIDRRAARTGTERSARFRHSCRRAPIPPKASHLPRGALPSWASTLKSRCAGVSEEDWADSWKKYYKPIKTGKRVVIVPVWEITPLRTAR